jgi:toxin HigB-1
MIVSFRHKGLRRFFESGKTAGIQPHHAKRLRMQLAALDTAISVDDMDIPGFRLHRLKGRDRSAGPSG